jgi:hypothetical protein
MMSDTTYPSLALKPAAAARGSLVRELIAAIPLFIFITAIRKAMLQPSRR